MPGSVLVQHLDTGDRDRNAVMGVEIGVGGISGVSGEELEVRLGKVGLEDIGDEIAWGPPIGGGYIHIPYITQSIYTHQSKTNLNHNIYI